MKYCYSIIRKRIAPRFIAMIVKLSRYFGQKRFMRVYVWYLRGMGVVVKGMPRYISPSTRIDTHANVEIGDKVIISDNVWILTHDYSITVGLYSVGLIDDEEKVIVSGVRIGDNSFIGLNAILLPGVRIGENVIVGAGAVVRGDVPSDSLVIGNPARVIGKVSEWSIARLQKGSIDNDVVDRSSLGYPMPIISSLKK
jgi:acetyltransferase-like isoleucine patch superfamily enzyme